jgi:hypothetical protein
VSRALRSNVTCRRFVQGLTDRPQASDVKIPLVCLSIASFVAVAVSFAAAPARAEPVYAWCAVSSSGGLGQPLCHFVTLEQCNAFLMGLTGSCRPNPHAAAPAQAVRRRAR